MKSQLNAYKRNQINTASQEDLVLMLYDGGRQYLSKGIKSLQSGDMQAAHDNLLRAQDIVSELMSGINFAAGEIARGLFSLYEYMHYRLIQANLHKDSQPAEEVLEMLGDLRDTWVQVMKARYSQGELNTQKKIAN